MQDSPEDRRGGATIERGGPSKPLAMLCRMRTGVAPFRPNKMKADVISRIPATSPDQKMIVRPREIS